MAGRAGCCTAPPQQQVWLQSHTSPLVLLHPCDDSHIKSLCVENLYGKKDKLGVKYLFFPCTYIKQPGVGDVAFFKKTTRVKYKRVYNQTSSTRSRALRDASFPPNKGELSVWWQVGPRGDPSIPVGPRSSRAAPLRWPAVKRWGRKHRRGGGGGERRD